MDNYGDENLDRGAGNGPSQGPIRSTNMMECSVSVKIPQFYSENPEWWFAQVESAFSVAGIIRDDTKCGYVVANLDKTAFPLVWGVISSLPTQGKYDAIKSRIINAYAEINVSKLRRLLRGQELGEDRPSVFLERMKTLAAGRCNDDVLKLIFMEQMPETIRGILAISDTEDLSRLS